MHFYKRYSLLTILMLVLFVGSRCQDKTETTTTGNRITKEDTAFIGNNYHLTRTRNSGTGNRHELWTHNQDTSKTVIKRYMNNRLISFSSYKHGQPDGTIIGCFPNGIVWVRDNYVNGKRHGRVKYYDKKGQLYSIEEYNNGTLLSTKEVVQKK